MSVRQVLTVVLVGLVSIGIGSWWNYYLAVGEDSTSCHLGVVSPEKYLATKRPYLFDDDEESLEHSAGESCQPELMWMMIRHGTRNPSKKVITAMQGRLKNLKEKILVGQAEGLCKICPEVLDALTNWEPTSISIQEEKRLVAQGATELYNIGKRFKKRFPKLFDKQYNNNTYKFKFTKTERTAASTQHFVNAIFGSEQAAKVWYPEAVHGDPVLRFYKECKRWKRDVDKNPETYSERVKFEQSPLFQDMLNGLRKRLGLGMEDELSVKDVETMYMTCAFETAWTPDTKSPWCSIFTEQEMKIMEYRQDVEYYWVDGYGHELTYKVACPAVKDLLDNLKEKAKDLDKGPSLIAYFSHSGTILKLLARLGLFKDSKPLLHHNFDHHQNRQWKTSEIDKFASNLAAVLYSCSGRKKVGFLFQEKPVPVPACGGQNLCDLDEFVNHYSALVSGCDISDLCKL